MNWEDASSLILKGVVAVVIVGLNAFFVAAEFALVRVRDTQLQPLAAKGNRRARLARRIIANLDAYLSTVQLGITLCGLGMGALVEPLFGELLEPVYRAVGINGVEIRRTLSFLFGFLSNTFVLIAVGELAPKSLALRRALPISLIVAYPLWIIYWACFPLIVALNKTSLWVLARLGLNASANPEGMHSEEELRLILTASQRQGGKKSMGRDLVLNAMDIHRRRAREVMQPRPEIVAFDTDELVTEAVKLAEETRYSRFPLCEEGNLDKTVGVIHIKDLYSQQSRARTLSDLRSLARPLIYIPEMARLDRVLHFLQDRRLHMAVVVDEHGGTVGLMTLENILEELVGQIQDEFDQERPLIVKLDETTWEVAGNLPLHDLAEFVGETLQQPGVSSTSGWVTQRLGGFPHDGDTVRVGAFLLRVEETRGARVTRLRLMRSATGEARVAESEAT